MRKTFVALTASVIGLWTAAVRGEGLTIGDPAPPLTVSKWVKGGELDRLDPEKTYVVEFWATWCGPCRATIPHLTELQKQYKDEDVTFIGVSIWEQDQEGVVPFVEEMGDQMDYRVAMDVVPEGKNGSEGKMAGSWMSAAEENGIPTAFVVQKGKVAWIGHPMALDKPLKKIVAGDFDLAQAAQDRRQAKAREAKMQELFTKLRSAANDPKKALNLINEALTDDPDLEQALGTGKFRLMMQEDPEAAVTYGMHLVDTVLKDEPNGLNDMAWGIVDPARDGKTSQKALELALKAAKRANELTSYEQWTMLDTLALVSFKTGDASKAVELQEKAIELAGDDHDPDLDARLEMYRTKAGDKKDN